MKQYLRLCALICVFLSTFAHATSSDTSDNQIVVGNFITDTMKNMQPVFIRYNNQSNAWSNIKNVSNLPNGSYRSVSCSGSLCVALGEEGQLSKNLLLLTSNNEGKSWIRRTNISTPIPAAWYAANDIACFAGSSCIMTGAYGSKENETTFHPLLMFTQNGGATWVADRGVIDSKSLEGELSFVKCFDSRCFIGSKRFRRSDNFPLLLVSQDKGKSWEDIKEIAGLSRVNHAEIYNINCNKNTCIAVGNFEENKKYYPLILQSHDNGKTWTKKAMDLFRLGHMDSIAHANNIFIAIGQDQNLSTKILTSQDNGDSWQLRDIKGFSNITQSIVHGVSCHKNICTSVIDLEGNQGRQPLFIVSKDSGLSWAAIKEIANLPKNNARFNVNSLNCNDSICTAAGVYASNVSDGVSDMRPLLFASKDHGQSWTFIKNIVGISHDTTGVFDVVSRGAG